MPEKSKVTEYRVETTPSTKGKADPRRHGARAESDGDLDTIDRHSQCPGAFARWAEGDRHALI